jgi:HxlR-like helix-turn-helix
MHFSEHHYDEPGEKNYSGIGSRAQRPNGRGDLRLQMVSDRLPSACKRRQPAGMVRSVDGLTTKVLNDCLRKNLDFGIINRVAYPEIPPRVEYEITAFGGKFIRILDQIESLQREIETR